MTRKFKIAAFITLFMLLPLLAYAAPIVSVNGSKLSLDTAPIIENGRVLVPFRNILEALGATVNWDKNSNTITAEKGGNIVKLTIGQKRAFKNDTEIPIDVAAKVVSNRTMVPLRFIAEAFGAKVDWDDKLQKVSIVTDEAKRIKAKVVRAIDGDTVEVKIGDKLEKVRLIGIDTPETVHPEIGEEPYGKEASKFTANNLEGRDVELELDVQERDKYGRLLAYVWIGTELFNETLIKEGYAQVSTFPPNVKYANRFVAAEKEARENKKGLWGNQNVQKEDKKYIGSKESNKYHLPSCQWAQKIKPENQVWFGSKEEAEKAGYQPCKVCTP